MLHVKYAGLKPKNLGSLPQIQYRANMQGGILERESFEKHS